MTPWRSTTLNLAARHCAAALDFYEAGAPYEREHFAVGVAAHACIEEVGRAAVAAGHLLSTKESERAMEAVCREMIERGRDFEGEREPPLHPDDVFRGRDLALSFVRDVPMDPGGQYEQVAAVNRQWIACPPEGAWLTARIDHVVTKAPGLALDAELDDEQADAAGPVLRVSDFKSAYSADDGELYTVQRKIQALTAWATWGAGHDVLQIVVVNLRLRRLFDLIILPRTEDGEKLMARWRRDVELWAEGLERMKLPDGSRPATPGAGCCGCPYLSHCEPAKRFLRTTKGDWSAKRLAEELAVLEARRDVLRDALKEATDEAPIEIPGGFVGSLVKEQETPKREAPEILAALWTRRLQGRDAEGVLAAFPGLLGSCGLGKAQYEAALRHLYDRSKEEQERKRRTLAAMLTKKVVQSFGVHRGADEGSEE